MAKLFCPWKSISLHPELIKELVTASSTIYVKTCFSLLIYYLCSFSLRLCFGLVVLYLLTSPPILADLSVRDVL